MENVCDSVCLKNFVHNLPEKQKKVVLLRLEGYSYKEIEEKTNLKSGCCRKIMYDVIKKMKKEVNDESKTTRRN